MASCAAVIPARYASTRLPGKPLLKETGKYLVQHVYERACRARRVDRVLVATDDPRILEAARSFGAEAVLTSPDHPTGTDRVAEAARELPAEVILNVQGDEPEIDPELLDGVAGLLLEEAGGEMATAAVPIRDRAAFESPHVVKVVLDGAGRALYFSRAPIPRGAAPGGDPAPLEHIGVYAYRREALLALSRLPPAPAERAERLEQLRALHHGMTIRVLVTPAEHAGIDTPEEYAAFVRSWKKREGSRS